MVAKEHSHERGKIENESGVSVVIVFDPDVEDVLGIVWNTTAVEITGTAVQG